MTPSTASGPEAAQQPQPKPRALLVLLLLAAVVGVFVSLAAWAFLELIHGIQTWVFTDLPKDLGYHNGAPLWLYVVVLGLAGLPIAFAIVRLPGGGGHIPAEGLKVGGDPVQPIDLPGVDARGARLDRSRDRDRTRGTADRARRRSRAVRDQSGSSATPRTRRRP